MPPRSPYSGDFKKLVLAFDVGTTYSGISYRYPAQERVGSDSKIPTIIYYDQQGNVRAVGAEALKADLEIAIEEEGWIKAEWFKLHLRPSSSISADTAHKIPPLPKDKTVLDIGEGVVIVDAGGGTIDITAYGHDSNAAGVLSFQEIATPQYLLRGTRFTDDVDDITRCFDKTTKLTFRDNKVPQFIKFGTSRDKDPSLGIRSGQLKMQGVDVAKFFEPSISSIIECILNQRRSSSKPLNFVFLVGGFAASDWLFSQLKTSLEPLGITFSRPDSHVNKAVADGGVSFYIDHFVSARVAKYAYGVICSTHYDPADPEHRSRRRTVYTNAAGDRMIPGTYSIILPKATQVSELTTFKQAYYRVYETEEEVNEVIKCNLLSYRGTLETPRWIDMEPGGLFLILQR
ncbi:hypothetical protein C0992_004796 [Termitomyces sp. T32_za158]|nr:hypothetical protein C0992_004796 [Termitomyces sp. T32_za158]